MNQQRLNFAANCVLIRGVERRETAQNCTIFFFGASATWGVAIRWDEDPRPPPRGSSRILSTSTRQEKNFDYKEGKCSPVSPQFARRSGSSNLVRTKKNAEFVLKIFLGALSSFDTRCEFSGPEFQILFEWSNDALLVGHLERTGLCSHVPADLAKYTRWLTRRTPDFFPNLQNDSNHDSVSNINVLFNVVAYGTVYHRYIVGQIARDLLARHKVPSNGCESRTSFLGREYVSRSGDFIAQSFAVRWRSRLLSFLRSEIPRFPYSFLIRLWPHKFSNRIKKFLVH